METEIEAKFPGIDADALRTKLKEVGATLVYPERLMRRKNYDYPDGRLDAEGGWIRVRDEGDKVTMAYKKVQDRTILHGTKEVEVNVESFESACAFLEAIGMSMKSVQETKREKWVLKESEITIDTWPWIPPFAEVEGPTEEEVKEVAATLGLDWGTAVHGGIDSVYLMHYNVTYDDVNHWKEIAFTPVPEWLLAKKK
jgi:adenylate cyclase class 2